jgi:hypothetical protein
LLAYGMAETTVAVAFSQCGGGLVVDEVDADMLAVLRWAVPATTGNTRRLASWAHCSPLARSVEGEPFRCQWWSAENQRGGSPRALRFLRLPRARGQTTPTVKEPPVNYAARIMAPQPAIRSPAFVCNRRATVIIGWAQWHLR